MCFLLSRTLYRHRSMGRCVVDFSGLRRRLAGRGNCRLADIFCSRLGRLCFGFLLCQGISMGLFHSLFEHVPQLNELHERRSA